LPFDFVDRRIKVKGDVSNISDDFGTHLSVCDLHPLQRLISSPLDLSLLLKVHPASGILLAIPFRSNCGGRRLNQYTINLEIQLQTLPTDQELPLPPSFSSLHEDDFDNDNFGSRRTPEPSSGVSFPIVTFVPPSQLSTKSKVFTPIPYSLTNPTLTTTAEPGVG
jgi:hypothetical protein